MSEFSMHAPRVGDCWKRWNYETIWSQLHKNPAQLEPLRMVGDPLADKCVEALGPVRSGTDMLGAVAQHVDNLTKHSCWQSDEQPDAPKEFQDQIMTVPAWVDWEMIKQGQDVFWTYCLPMLLTLGHYSLAGGFGAPAITKTLACTSYLGTSSLIFRRLLETTRFLLDCMNGVEALQPGTGAGWEAIVRVRLLHSQVRRRIMHLAAKDPSYYSVNKVGVPINQEDCIATLCSFSILSILALEKLGINMTRKETSAFLHLWRLIGYYMGILPENDPLLSKEDAKASVESVVQHLVRPDELSISMTRTFIQGMSRQPPMRLSPELHSAISRALLGEELSDALQIEPTGWYYQILAALIFALLRLSCLCRSWFLTLRIRLIKKLVLSTFHKLADQHDVDSKFAMKVVPGLVTTSNGKLVHRPRVEYNSEMSSNAKHKDTECPVLWTHTD